MKKHTYFTIIANFRTLRIPVYIDGRYHSYKIYILAIRDTTLSIFNGKLNVLFQRSFKPANYHIKHEGDNLTSTLHFILILIYRMKWLCIALWLPILYLKILCNFV